MAFNKKRNNEVYQTIIFQDLEKYYNKAKVKEWIKKKNFKIMTSKGKNAIKKYQGSYRVRQINPNRIKSNTFRTIQYAKGIKAVVGVLKK